MHSENWNKCAFSEYSLGNHIGMFLVKLKISYLLKLIRIINGVVYTYVDVPQ